MKKALVVARFRENLDWLADVDETFEIRVYDKGPAASTHLPGSARETVEKLGNVGREPHSYLRYILDGYDDPTGIADVVVFSQGEPGDHVGATTPREKATWVSSVAEEALNDPRGVSSHGVAAHAEGCNSATPSFTIHSAELRQRADGADLGRWYRSCTGLEFPSSGARWCKGACFAVTSAALRRVPLRIWRRLMASVDSLGSAPVTAHYLERAWIELLLSAGAKPVVL